MKLKKIITICACGLIVLASIISNISVHAEELKKLEIPVKVTGGTGTIEIKGNDDASELVLEGNQIIETNGEDAFFVLDNNEPFEHEYTVKQTAVEDGYVMDETVYTVHVFVTQEEEGLVSTVAVWKQGTETKCDSVAFENKKIEKSKKSSDTSDDSSSAFWGGTTIMMIAAVIVFIGLRIKNGNGSDDKEKDSDQE